MKAAKVFPEPVGAATSTLRPVLMAGQACVCAAVGARKVRSNQAATAGWNNPEGAVINSDAQAQHNSCSEKCGKDKLSFCDGPRTYGDRLISINGIAAGGGPLPTVADDRVEHRTRILAIP